MKSILSPFHQLQPFLVNEIFSYLPDSNLARVKKVSRFFNEMVAGLQPMNSVCVLRNRPICPKDLQFLWDPQTSMKSEPETLFKIAILAAEGFEKYKGDDRAIIQAFKRFGAKAEHVIWNNGNLHWKNYDAVMVRSTWDYTRGDNLPKFLAVLHRIDRLGIPIFNSLQTIEWNSRKTYLKELARKGVSCIETLWISGKNLKHLESIIKYKQWGECVIKPSVSAGGANTYRIRPDNLNSIITTCEKTRVNEWMLQPFKREIVEEGEWSFLLLEGKPIRFILKTPAKGNFLVQDFHGGKAHVRQPAPWMVTHIEEIFKSIGHDALFGRIDVVRSGMDLQIMEVEMIEPYAFLDGNLPLVREFAWAAVRRLHHSKHLHACFVNIREFSFIYRELRKFKENSAAVAQFFSTQPKDVSMSPKAYLEDDAGQKILAKTAAQQMYNADKESFPETITEYETSVIYGDDKELHMALAVVAESVASLYSSFLIPDHHVKRRKALSFYNFPENFPSPQEVKLFKDSLKEQIIRGLNQKDEDYDFMHLFTGTSPESMLKDVLLRSHINWDRYSLNSFFPEETTTGLYRFSRNRTVKVMMTTIPQQGFKEWLRRYNSKSCSEVIEKTRKDSRFWKYLNERVSINNRVNFTVIIKS